MRERVVDWLLARIFVITEQNEETIIFRNTHLQ